MVRQQSDLILFGYIEITLRTTGRYMLMLWDDHSDCKWFFTFVDSSARNAGRAIVDWCAAFGVSISLMSICPTHLKIRQIGDNQKALKYHIVLRFCIHCEAAMQLNDLVKN